MTRLASVKFNGLPDSMVVQREVIERHRAHCPQCDWYGEWSEVSFATALLPGRSAIVNEAAEASITAASELGKHYHDVHETGS